jgi:transposase
VGHTAPPGAAYFFSVDSKGEQGFCLYYKVLERGHFPCPKATEGKVALTPAQMSMLWEGMDWRQPRWTSAPTRM